MEEMLRPQWLGHFCFYPLSFLPAITPRTFAPMAQYLSNIADYYKYLCEQHPLLLHSNTSGARVFEVKAYEQAFSDFRTAIKPKDYFVRMILPTMTMRSQQMQAVKNYQVGLVFGKFYSRREGSSTDLLNAYTDAEKLADSFITRMVADSRNGHPLFFGSIDVVDNLKVQGDFWQAEGDGSYGAVMYLFDFSTFRGLDADCSDVVWLDGGLTPYP